MNSRMTEMIKQEEQLDVEGVWMINPIKSDYENLLPSPLLPKMDDPGMRTYSLHHYCLRWTTLECRPYTAPSTKEVSREVVHDTGTCIMQCQRWQTKTTNSGTILCKTSPSRFKTVHEHHRTQEELDAETFPEFTSPVGTELTGQEAIKKIERNPLNPNQPNT
jgi:hypothetical protein